MLISLISSVAIDSTSFDDKLSSLARSFNKTSPASLAALPDPSHESNHIIVKALERDQSSSQVIGSFHKTRVHTSYTSHTQGKRETAKLA